MIGLFASTLLDTDLLLSRADILALTLQDIKFFFQTVRAKWKEEGRARTNLEIQWGFLLASCSQWFSPHVTWPTFRNALGLSLVTETVVRGEQQSSCQLENTRKCSGVMAVNWIEEITFRWVSYYWCFVLSIEMQKIIWLILPCFINMHFQSWKIWEGD